MDVLTSTICSFLRCIRVHHIIKLIRVLVQKTFKCSESILSHLWVNMSQYFLINPPLILFTINVALFTLTLTFISLYAKVVEVSESGEEWKGFLQSFSKLELCIVPFNPNSTTQTTTTSTLATLSNKQTHTHSIPIYLSISPTSEFNGIPQKLFHLSTSMYGKHIGLEEEDSQVLINVTLSFRHTWNSSACDTSKLLQCQFSNIKGCMSFNGPRDIFPENKHAEHCPKELRRPRGELYYAGLNWQVPDVNPLYYCRSRSMIKATFDEFLSESNSEKVIEPSARFHLLSASFFLTIFIVIILLYAALLEHKPRYININKNNNNNNNNNNFLGRVSPSSSSSDTADVEGSIID